MQATCSTPDHVLVVCPTFDRIQTVRAAVQVGQQIQISPNSAFCSTRTRWWRTSSSTARKMPTSFERCMPGSNSSAKHSRPRSSSRAWIRAMWTWIGVSS